MPKQITSTFDQRTFTKHSRMPSDQDRKQEATGWRIGSSIRYRSPVWKSSFNHFQTGSHVRTPTVWFRLSSNSWSWDEGLSDLILFLVTIIAFQINISWRIFLLPPDFVLERNQKGGSVSTICMSGWVGFLTSPAHAGGTDKSLIANIELAKHKIR